LPQRGNYNQLGRNVAAKTSGLCRADDMSIEGMQKLVRGTSTTPE
jgi:hypothetical protein